MKENKELESLLKIQKEGFEAEITEVDQTDSDTYYAKLDDEGKPIKSKYENRKGYRVTFKIVGNDGAEWNEFFSHPTPQGFLSVKSKLGNFCRKYDTYPQEGMKVKAEIDEDGFFRVLI